MNILTSFPDSRTLLKRFPQVEILNVNAHVHTPYSFSAFDSIAQLFELARKENLAAVGINDFFVTDGYDEFYAEALKQKIFPLFNIEFIGLLKKEQQLGIRVNDPGNPGRCYCCGKGLHYPFTLRGDLKEKLGRLVDESQEQVRSMIDKANDWFSVSGINLKLNYEEIRSRYAKKLVRERHIAKAVRTAIFEQTPDAAQQLNWLTVLFDGKKPESALTDMAGLENEIRNNLLKAGGKAFVPEDESAFPSLADIVEIVVSAGGIPCYPVLLDDKKGQFTEFEEDFEQLLQNLKENRIGCVELIPGRNDAAHLERFVRFFNQHDFVILFGTEHNAPGLIPMTCHTRGSQPLTGDMKRIAYEGACVVAAHQYLEARQEQGFIEKNGMPCLEKKTFMVGLGNAVIHYFANYQNTR